MTCPQFSLSSAIRRDLILRRQNAHEAFSDGQHVAVRDFRLAEKFSLEPAIDLMARAMHTVDALIWLKGKCTGDNILGQGSTILTWIRSLASLH